MSASVDFYICLSRSLSCLSRLSNRCSFVSYGFVSRRTRFPSHRFYRLFKLAQNNLDSNQSLLYGFTVFSHAVFYRITRHRQQSFPVEFRSVSSSVSGCFSVRFNVVFFGNLMIPFSLSLTLRFYEIIEYRAVAQSYLQLQVQLWLRGHSGGWEGGQEVVMIDSSDYLAVAVSLFLFFLLSWLCSRYFKYIRSRSVSTTKNLRLWVDWASG